MTKPLRYTRSLLTAALLLAVCLAAGCGRARDVNELTNEMKALRAKGSEIAQEAADKFGVVSQTFQDEEKKAQTQTLAQEGSDLFRQASEHFRRAGDKAEQASKLKIEDWRRNYLTLSAQSCRKKAEALDLYSQAGDVIAKDMPRVELLLTLLDLNGRAEKLNAQENAIAAQVKRIEEEHKDAFNQNGGAN